MYNSSHKSLFWTRRPLKDCEIIVDSEYVQTEAGRRETLAIMKAMGIEIIEPPREITLLAEDIKKLQEEIDTAMGIPEGKLIIVDSFSVMDYEKQRNKQDAISHFMAR